MREIHIRDLHTELGEQIDATKDMESFLEIRLEMARVREGHAREVAKHAEENYRKAAEGLEEAASKSAYWEDQLQKVRERNQPTTATESRTFVVHTNGVSAEEIDQWIQKKASEVFKYPDEEFE